MSFAVRERGRKIDAQNYLFKILKFIEVIEVRYLRLLYLSILKIQYNLPVYLLVSLLE